VRRCRRAFTLGVIAIVIAACGSVSPVPSGAPDVTSSPARSSRPSTSADPSPESTPGGTLGSIASLMAIKAADASFSSRVLEFASTGSAIIASAGMGDDAAPDLYSILPSTGEPCMLWENPERQRSIVKLAGDGDTIAFVDMPVSGDVDWTLRLIPDAGEEAIVLDEYAGDGDASSMVPSFSVYWPYVAWTAFDAGPDGPVSQLLVAEFPDWEPSVIAERHAADAELWFPHVYGASLLYTELTYAEDRESDDRTIWLTDVHGTDPERLDATGLATMPVMNQYGIAWKEGELGFHMLNWGAVTAYDADDGTALPVTGFSANFPSAGERYMTWWSVDSSRLEVWDARRAVTRDIVTYDDEALQIQRPHVEGGLLAWLFVDESVEPSLREIRYAYLP
jgi:hypothetical protein